MAGGRTASGDAGGCLDGEFPQPGMGTTLLAGYHIRDDFNRAGNNPAGTWGDLLWTPNNIGAAPVPTDQAPVAETEAGIIRLTTTGVVNQGGTLGLSATSFFRSMPASQTGSLFSCKVRIQSVTTTMRAWVGFASSLVTDPAAAAAMSLVGFRYDPLISANWMMVIKNGAGAESQVDTLALANSTWRKFAIRRTMSGFQCYTQGLNGGTSDLILTLDSVGGLITSNIPVVPCFPCIGVTTLANATRNIEVDFWELSGRIAR